MNIFAHPVNSTCLVLPKIAHPVNYLIHRKMGITIIENGQFRPMFWPNFLYLRAYPLAHPWNLLMPKVVRQLMSKTLPMKPVLCFSWWYHFEGNIFQQFWYIQNIWVRALKIQAANPVSYFPQFWGKKKKKWILRIAHPVNYSYLPPWFYPW